MPRLPLAVVPLLGTPRLVPVTADTMEPTLRMGQVLAVVPLDGWRGPGLYLLDRPPEPQVWRCSPLAGGALRLALDRPGSEFRTVTRDEFADMVLGQVAGVVRVLEHALLGV